MNVLHAFLHHFDYSHVMQNEQNPTAHFRPFHTMSRHNFMRLFYYYPVQKNAPGIEILYKCVFSPRRYYRRVTMREKYIVLCEKINKKTSSKASRKFVRSCEQRSLFKLLVISCGSDFFQPECRGTKNWF